MSSTGPLQAHPDHEAGLRNQAIDLYILGEKPTAIATQLGRSRLWFYKVLVRFRLGGRDGLASRSRAPKRVHNRTLAEMEAAVVRVREAITGGKDPILRYANIGADAIAVELERADLTPPSRATINRILRRRGLVRPRPHKGRKVRLPDDYPWPQVQAPNQLHLFDFVVRTLAGGSRFYGCHLLDQGRRWPFLGVITVKDAETVSRFLVSAWQEIGLPTALYLDNDVVWRGSSHAARTISRVVRLCLWVGVEVIFIPPYTPEANPVMESFNSVWNENFWRRSSFQNLPQLETELGYFQQYCRTRRPLAEFNHRTADQLYPDFVPFCLPVDFAPYREARLPLTVGKIHFIRFVAADGMFSVLNGTWHLDPKTWSGKTIRATIDTQQQEMQVYHQENVKTPGREVARFTYELREEALPLQPEFIRQRPDFWA